MYYARTTKHNGVAPIQFVPPQHCSELPGTATYHFIPQSAGPVRLCTTEYYATTAPVLRSTTPVLQHTVPVLPCTTSFLLCTSRVVLCSSPFLLYTTPVLLCTTKC